MAEPVDIEYEEAVSPPEDTQPPLLQVNEPVVMLDPGERYIVGRGVSAVDFESDTPPQLEVQGLEEVQRYASDAVLIASLPSTEEQGRHGPLTLVYSATDSSGNVAPTVTQEVYFSLPVTTQCSSQEYICPDGQCSVSGLCISLTGTQDAGRVLRVLPSEPINSERLAALSAQTTSAPDLSPPTLLLLGEPPTHQRAISDRTGEVLIETTLTVGQTYVDAGAAAYDDIDGQIDKSVSAYGLGAIDTNWPTPPNTPSLIRYRATDVAGNVSPELVRRVFVTCPQDQWLCQQDDGSWACSDIQAACLPRSPPTSGSFGDELTPPVLLLQGSELVEVVQGTPYGKCPTSGINPFMCDQGATAFDTVDGDLTPWVQACAPGFHFSEHGLQGCGIDTSVVGDYTVTFSILGSASTEVISVSRIVRVLAQCPEQEDLCSDGTCSEDGVCELGLYEPTTQQRLPPSIALVGSVATKHAGQDLVPHGWTYERCDESSLPTAAFPCEPGVIRRLTDWADAGMVAQAATTWLSMQVQSLLTAMVLTSRIESSLALHRRAWRLGARATSSESKGLMDASRTRPKLRWDLFLPSLLSCLTINFPHNRRTSRVMCWWFPHARMIRSTVLTFPSSADHTLAPSGRFWDRCTLNLWSLQRCPSPTTSLAGMST